MRNEIIRAVEEVALADPKVVVVASDPGPDLMPELVAQHPDRFLMEGVCEQGLVGFAAGLASEGYYPYIIMLAVFGSRRCYEQLLLDFGLHEFAGCMVGIGGGLTYANLGPTHLAVDDFLLHAAIPGSAVIAPGDPQEAIQLTKQARQHAGFSYVRIGATTKAFAHAKGEVVLGKARVLQEPGAVLFISCGSTTLSVESALSLLKEQGIDAGALHLHTVKPLDVEAVRSCARRAKVVICAEEHRQIGGLSSTVLNALTSGSSPCVPQRFASVGIDNTFPFGFGTYEDLMAHYHLDGASLAARARRLLAEVEAGPRCTSPRQRVTR